MNTHRRFLLLFGSAALLTACGTTNNARLDVAGQRTLCLSDARAHDARALAPSTAPSISGVSRAHWEPTTIELLSDGTQHWPRLTNGGPSMIKSAARLRGEHPTALTALDIKPDRWAAAQEWLAGPFHAGADVVLAIPRAIAGASKGWAVASPANWYQRGIVRYDGPDLSPAVVPIDEQTSAEGGDQ